jgi:hypothetical protein
MNILLLALAAGFAATLSPAVAQPTPSQLTSEQRDVIRKHILQEARPATILPADLAPEAGATVPLNIELFWMPHSTGTEPLSVCHRQSESDCGGPPRPACR